MITIKHQIAVPLPRVWQAWTEPSQLCNWDPDRIDGEVLAGQVLMLHWDSLGASIEVEVLARREEEELLLRIQRDDGDAQELRVLLHALPSKCTSITLQVSGVPSEDERLGTAAGWYTQLRILERYLHLQPSKRTSFAAFGTAVLPLARAYDAMSDLGSWLACEEIHLEREGQCFALATRPNASGAGLTLRGEVISLVFGRELAFWCSELGGVVRLRALPLAGGRARLLGAQVIRWGESDMGPAVQDALHAGVERLIGELGGATGSA